MTDIRDHIWRLILGMVTVTAIASVLLVSSPKATAEPKVVIVDTGTGNLNVRALPSSQAPLLGTIRNGTRMVITCFVHGQMFAGGPFGGESNIWNKREGAGFVTDRMLDTGSDAPVVPPCAPQSAGNRDASYATRRPPCPRATRSGI